MIGIRFEVVAQSVNSFLNAPGDVDDDDNGWRDGNVLPGETKCKYIHIYTLWSAVSSVVVETTTTTVKTEQRIMIKNKNRVYETTEISHSENVAHDRRLVLYKEYFFSLFILLSPRPANTIVKSNRLVILYCRVQIIYATYYVSLLLLEREREWYRKRRPKTICII